MAELFAGCLDDPRVTIRTEDVGQIIRASRSVFDAILLDVDNGPDALTHVVNQRLYSHQGVSAARNALRPGGILAFLRSSGAVPVLRCSSLVTSGPATCPIRSADTP